MCCFLITALAVSPASPVASLLMASTSFNTFWNHIFAIFDVQLAFFFSSFCVGGIYHNCLGQVQLQLQEHVCFTDWHITVRRNFSALILLAELDVDGF